jgi:hypothetical protein
MKSGLLSRISILQGISGLNWCDPWDDSYLLVTAPAISIGVACAGIGSSSFGWLGMARRAIGRKAVNFGPGFRQAVWEFLLLKLD